MSFRASLVRLIIFTLVTVVSTAILAATIANANFGDMSGYTARFTDASGLKPGDDVRISGVKVGQVKDIAIAEDHLADVRFDVDGDYRLPSAVTATVRYRNVIGQRYLALGTHAESPGELPNGGTIPVERTKPALNLTVLFNGFKPLFRALDPEQVNALSAEIIKVFQGEGGTISSLLEHTASLTSHIAGRDKVIGEVIDNLDTVLKTINDRGPQTEELIDAMQQLVSGLAAKRKPIGEATEALGDLTTSVAGLLGDVREPLRADVKQLGRLAGVLNEGEDTVEEALRRMPRNLAKYTRVLSYGGWYNYYLCDISGTIGVESLNVNLDVLPLATTSRPERCGP